MDNETLTIEASLDGLLMIWHEWASSERVGQGYPSEAPGCKLYRVSRQYDTDNGAADSDADASIGAAVDALVQQMQDPHRTAITFNARNLKTGACVWMSPRLPMCQTERAIVVMEARNQITRRLQSAGLM
jgi:hypothetical protein